MIQSKSTASKFFKVVKYLFAAFIFVYCVFPFLWMLSTSFKSAEDVFHSPPKFITDHMSLENYVNAIRENNLLLYLKNSLIITLATVVLTIAIATLAAFAIGYLRLPGGEALRKLLFLLQMLPSVVAIVPLFIVFGKMGLLNTHRGLIMAYLGGTVPVTVILLVGFFDDIPKDIGEAAMIDGCSIMKAFFHVILPVSIPGLVSSAIYTFIRVWQEFIMALSLTTSKSMYTLPIGLKAYEGSNQTDWGGLMATAVVISVPAIILFVAAQKQFIDSMSGSVKG